MIEDNRDDEHASSKGKPRSAVGARIDPKPPTQAGDPHDPEPPRREPENDQAPVAFAGFWRRLAAYILDTIIVWIPTLLVLELAGFPIPEPPPTPEMAGMAFEELVALAEEMSFYAFAAFLVQWPYFAGFEASAWQATPGKRLVKVKVVDTDGERVTLLRATGRYFSKLASEALLYIGYIMIGFTREKRGLHDMMASTRVQKP